nr:PREDICTED: serine/threonine-protein kinase 31 isoform X2 [Latimeria chalumnae]|eukprot:XP_014344521.1 PREDICTED: serine/threonine-protein kinase 31 isoform X2 [Latimeria chalumnae]
MVTSKMDEEVIQGKIEDVVGSHVEDAVTFWAQSMNSPDILQLPSMLADVCPLANPVFGTPDCSKIYGGIFSEDRCWYRCKLQQIIDDEKCTVTYIDYGNSETLSRTSIVELPEDLQFPSIAKKYRLYGLQLPPNQDVSQFEQGLKFLSSLIFEKQINVCYKGCCKDGSIFVQAKCGEIDIGQEVAKKGFAGNSTPNYTSNNIGEQKNTCVSSAKGTRGPFGLRANRQMEGKVDQRIPQQFNRFKGRAAFSDLKTPDMREDNLATYSSSSVSKDKKLLPEHPPAHNSNTIKMRQDQKLIEENEKLKAENSAILQNSLLLESQLQELKLEVKKEKDMYKEHIEELEASMKSAVGSKIRSLVAKIEVLRSVRQTNTESRFGDDLSEAVKLITDGCLSSPTSLKKLESTWTEYNFAQEMLQLCKDVNELNDLIVKRNNVRQALYSAAEEFVVEVDQLPVDDRRKTLLELSSSLESVYSAITQEEVSEDIFKEFFDWKNGKLQEFNNVRNEADGSLHALCTCLSDIRGFFDLSLGSSMTSEEVVGNIDNLLEKAELDICKELEISLAEQGDADNAIMLKTYCKVMSKIHQEQQLLVAVQNKYVASIQFKSQIAQWLDETPNIDQLLSIKKSMKIMKAQLRWKLVEKSNMEECDEPSEAEIVKLRDEISSLRSAIYREVFREQEEYEKLSTMMKNWFPELPLLHPEARILNYTESAGLLSNSLERDLFDGEPMKELSNKRPLVCAEMQGQKVILKGYSVDHATEAKILKRAARYHKAWFEYKEESGLIQIMFLFLCKSDPLAYIVLPFYPGRSLKILQATDPLTTTEVVKVMRGVATGLQTLHHSNIVHGSLHPSNVFVINRKQGIVADFDFTLTKDQRSSANWMLTDQLSLVAPELQNKEPACPSSDMYAFGCLLLWMCFPDHEFVVQSNGIPKITALHMDCKLEALVSKLICPSDRLTATQVLEEEYFLLAGLAHEE